MRILVVDDDETLRFTLSSNLKNLRHEVITAFDGQNALDVIAKEMTEVDLIFLDINMPRLSGLETLCKLKKAKNKSFCVMLTAYADIKDAVYAIKNGAYDYIEKPFDLDSLESLLLEVDNALNLLKQITFSAPKLFFNKDSTMIGDSSEITKVYEIIDRLSKVDSSVLIEGESGTGKELVARAIHYNSKRKKEPFVAINCGAIPENLIESELFGFEKGSFTGASQKKIGKIQYAEGGTLFLDEIGDISLSMQVKLLRVLQEKTFTPLGSVKEIPSNLRIIAATNKDLTKLIEEEKFRLDLYYRINVLPIKLPPLRERKEDIPKLVNHLIEKFNQNFDHKIKCASDDSLDYLKNYSWPGNIRELANVIERCFIFEKEDIIHKNTLIKNLELCKISSKEIKTEIFSPTKEEPSKKHTENLDFQTMKENFEKNFLEAALQSNSGKINQTALKTNIPKVTLLRKLAKYAINPKKYTRS
jgi:DNA-binding NtrC family response regulator